MKTTIIYEPSAGNHINGACGDAVEKAKQEHCNVQFKFNDQTLVATPESDAKAIHG